MEKIKLIALIILGVIAAYIILISVTGFIVDTANDTADQVAAEHDMSKYIAADDGVRVMPIIFYFIPGVVGIAAIVYVWKRRNT